MKVQILSDLHLEHSNIDLKINSDINVLILAGDISADFTVLDFLLNKVPSTTQVLYVLGNHEYEIHMSRRKYTEFNKYFIDWMGEQK